MVSALPFDPFSTIKGGWSGTVALTCAERRRGGFPSSRGVAYFGGDITGFQSLVLD